MRFFFLTRGSGDMMTFFFFFARGVGRERKEGKDGDHIQTGFLQICLSAASEESGVRGNRGAKPLSQESERECRGLRGMAPHPSLHSTKKSKSLFAHRCVSSFSFFCVKASPTRKCSVCSNLGRLCKNSKERRLRDIRSPVPSPIACSIKGTGALSSRSQELRSQKKKRKRKHNVRSQSRNHSSLSLIHSFFFPPSHSLLSSLASLLYTSRCITLRCSLINKSPPSLLFFLSHPPLYTSNTHLQQTEKASTFNSHCQDEASTHPSKLVNNLFIHPSIHPSTPFHSIPSLLLDRLKEARVVAHSSKKKIPTTTIIPNPFLLVLSPSTSTSPSRD